jgi:hypothetical protein
MDQFVKWNLLAIWHSLVVFYFTYAIYVPMVSFSYDGKVTLGPLIVARYFFYQLKQ